MLKKFCLIIMTAFLLITLAVSAPADDTVKSKVIKIETDKVTVLIEGAVPAWVKVGSPVSAGDGAPRVLSVQGNTVLLRFSKAKAAKIKPDSTMQLSEFTGDELQGC